QAVWHRADRVCSRTVTRGPLAQMGNVLPRRSSGSPIRTRTRRDGVNVNSRTFTGSSRIEVSDASPQRIALVDKAALGGTGVGFAGRLYSLGGGLPVQSAGSVADAWFAGAAGSRSNAAAATGVGDDKRIDDGPIGAPDRTATDPAEHLRGRPDHHDYPDHHHHGEYHNRSASYVVGKVHENDGD